MKPSHESDLDRFLAGLAEGEVVSSGSFTVASENMLEKLSKAVEDFSVWVLKLAQAAAASGAGIFSVKVGKRTMAATALGHSHPDLPSAEQFLREAQRSRSHYHLLLALLWSGKSAGTRWVRLRWSSETSVEEMFYDGKRFESKRFELDQPNRFRFLKLELDRTPLTLVARLFGHTDFSSELVCLERNTFLSRLSISVDGRRFHLGRFCQESVSAGFHDSPGSTNQLRFEVPRRLAALLPQSRRAAAEAQFRIGGTVHATVYAEVLVKPATSQVYWVIDGVSFPSQSLPDQRGVPGQAYLLFLALEPEATDVSTLRPLTNRRTQERLGDLALWDWLRRL